jgi:hypothetical protein
VHEANDIAGGRVWVVFIAGDDPLWLRGVHQWTKDPFLDEPRCDLVGEAGASLWIHREERESTLMTTAVMAAAAG